MERFATIEKEYELHLHELPDRHPRLVAMEAREGSSERDAAGRRAGEITFGHLVRTALRMNLRRIIVGEVRGQEIMPMLEAMSTGDGSLDVHAPRSHRRPRHRPDRHAVPEQPGSGIGDAFAYRLVAGAVDLVVHIGCSMRPRSAAGGIGTCPRCWRSAASGRPTGPPSRPCSRRDPTARRPRPTGRTCPDELVRAGFDPPCSTTPRDLAAPTRPAATLVGSPR